ncbi:hypothetical protein PQX77_008021 [Marasmius sp. AFHP31]|nr:hypothetical protein PQX77_008021 [Marasmius sp. AFHP31]
MTRNTALTREATTIDAPSDANINEINTSTQTDHLVRDVAVATVDDLVVTVDTQSTPTPCYRRPANTEHLPPRLGRFTKLLREIDQGTQQSLDDNDTGFTLTPMGDHSLSSNPPTTDVSPVEVESGDTQLPDQKRLYGAEHIPARFERSWITFRDQEHAALVVLDEDTQLDTAATGTPLGGRRLSEFSNGALKRKRDDTEDAQKEQPTKRGRGRPRKVPAAGGEKAKMMVAKGRKRKDSENVKPSRSSARLQAAANRYVLSGEKNLMPVVDCSASIG